MVAEQVEEMMKMLKALESTVAEQAAKMEKLEEDREDDKKKMEKLEEDINDLNGIKEDFGDKLQAKLAQITNEMHMADGKLKEHQEAIMITYEGAKQEFASMRKDNQDKFEFMMTNLQDLYKGAEMKFAEVDGLLKQQEGGANSGKKGNRRNGFLPEKMMVPKVFENDVGAWRKWKDEVSKYFDDEKEGMEGVLEEVAKQESPVTQSVLQTACDRNGAVVEQVRQWKFLYRALEKLTDGESLKVAR